MSKKRNYERLDIVTFGTHLLSSNDLDPIYVALVAMDLPDDQLSRWLVAYWCFYHAGVASYLSEKEGEDFWAEFRKACLNEEESPVGARWERGSERRHFRGANAMKTFDDLSGRYPKPEAMVDYIVYGSEGKIERTPLSYRDITKRSKEHSGFGPWIAFKIADMVDRVIGYDVDFSTNDVFMFKDPKQAALLLWRNHHGYGEHVKPKEAVVVSAVVEHLTELFASDYKAPPFYDRPVGLQEIETVLCKWKSHMNGHYPLNNDLIEINEGLNQWALVSRTAQLFRRNLP